MKSFSSNPCPPATHLPSKSQALLLTEFWCTLAEMLSAFITISCLALFCFFFKQVVTWYHLVVYLALFHTINLRDRIYTELSRNMYATASFFLVVSVSLKKYNLFQCFLINEDLVHQSNEDPYTICILFYTGVIYLWDKFLYVKLLDQK